MPTWIFPDRELVAILKQIEGSYDTNTLVYDNINIWPVLRMEIRENFINLKEFAFESDPNRSPPKKTTSPILSFARRHATGGIGYLSSWYNHVSAAAGFHRFIDGLSNNKPDILFLTQEGDFREQLDGRRYSAEFDPIIEKIRTYGTILKITPGNGNFFDDRYFTPVATIDSQFYSLSSFVKMRRYRQRISDRLEIADLNRVIFKKSGGRIQLDEKMIAKQIGYLFTFRDYFLSVFGRIRPKTIFLSGYYNYVWMGAILAARELGIKVVDIQHGWQGDIHYMYSNWTKTPDSGYDLLPDFFWVWSDFFQKTHQEWIPAVCGKHKVVVGGHLWLQTWQNSEIFRNYRKEVQKVFDSHSSFEKKILVTVEYTDPPLLPHLVEAMKKTQGEWLWFVRFHPLLKQHREKFVAFFARNKINNVEMEQANALPLYPLLENTDHHVSYMSTVIFEASAFSKPTTIIHEIGYANFLEFINAGVFAYAKNSEELINSIRNPITEFERAKEILNISPSAWKDAMDRIAQETGLQNSGNR